MKQMFKYIGAVCILTVLIFTIFVPASVVRAAQEPVTPAITIDWGFVLTQLLSILIPAMVAAVTGYVLVGIRYLIAKTKAEQPTLFAKIKEFAVFAVPVVEQLKKTGVIPDNAVAKQWATDIVERCLAQAGYKVELDIYADMISDAIEGAVNEYRAKYGLGPVFEVTEAAGND